MACGLAHAAGPSKNAILVTVNKQSLTVDDFRHWWENWKDKDTPFPQTPDTFIDWFLETQEAINMELYKEPAYQGKVLTFLKARALMMLKYDEIDSKVKITEKEMKDRYIKEYTPAWKVQVLFLKTDEAAKKMCADLKSGKLKMDDVMKQIKPGGDIVYQERTVRPKGLPADWLPVIKGLKPGQFTDPLKISTSFAVLKLIEVKEPGKDDYNLYKKGVRKEIWDKDEAELTNALIERLKKKYKIQIHQDIFDAIKMEGAPKEILDKSVISTSRGNVTARLFIEQLKNEYGFRNKNSFQKIPDDDLKKMLLNNMISQTVTSWDSMDQGYEKRPPFKWIYQYYCQHRLITELEGRLIQSKIHITDDDVKKFYDSHPDDFTMPDVVTYIQIEDDKKLIDKIWVGVERGEDFSEIIKTFYSKEFPAQSVPLNHLHAPAKEIVAKLSIGEVSHPFTMDGKSVIIKLLDKKASTLTPFKDVKDNIKSRLEGEKFKDLRDALLKQLKTRSKVSAVNEKLWNSLKREYANEKHVN